MHEGSLEREVLVWCYLKRSRGAWKFMMPLAVEREQFEIKVKLKVISTAIWMEEERLPLIFATDFHTD